MVRLLLSLVLLLPSLALASPPPLREGDLIFQTSRSGQSEAIRFATSSPWSHVGVVMLERGQPVVLEAAQTVRTTPLAQFVARGEGGRFVVLRLADADAILTPVVLQRLRETGRGYLGRPYDLKFRWDDESLYCSELVHKLFSGAAGVRLGKLQKASELALGSAAVQRLLHTRYPQGIPADTWVLTPKSLFDDARLVEVARSP